jgi:hypothetical protein
MNVNKLFPSKWLRAADLDGRRVTATAAGAVGLDRDWSAEEFESYAEAVDPAPYVTPESAPLPAHPPCMDEDELITLTMSRRLMGALHAYVTWRKLPTKRDRDDWINLLDRALAP